MVHYICKLKSIDEKIILDHLGREKPGSNKWWRYPAQTDVQQVEREQILNIDVRGEWKFDSRANRFFLSNANDIVLTFNHATSYLEYKCKLVLRCHLF